MNSTSNSFYVNTKVYTYTVHAYFLSVLTRRKGVLKKLQKSKITVPHSIFTKPNLSIWFWFFNEKGIHKKVEQRFLKYSVLYSFFCLRNRRVNTTRNFNEYEILIDVAEKKEIVDYFFMVKISIRKQRYFTKQEMVNLAIERRNHFKNAESGKIAKNKFVKRGGIQLETIREDVYEMVYHDKYMNYSMDYFLIVNRHGLEKLKRSSYSSKLSCIYSYDVHYKKPLFFRVKVEVESDDILTWKFEILRINAKGTIVNESNSKKFLSKDILHLEAIDEYSYFTISKHNETNEKIKQFMIRLVRSFDSCSYEKIKEISVYVMKPLRNSGMSLLEVLDTKVNEEGKVVELNRYSMKKFNKKFIIEKRREFLNRLVLEKEQNEQKSTRVDIKGMRNSQLFRLTGKQKVTDDIRKCSGLYCNQRSRFEAAMIDEKDDKNNLYLSKGSLKKVYKEEYKSIILDYVEHTKTIQRVQSVTHWQKEKVESLSDGLLIKFRKFYSLYKIQRCKLFEHLRYIHFYQEMSVCAICKAYYKKLNDLRISNTKYVSPFVQNPSKIINEIKRYGVEVGPVFNVKGPMKKLFSENFTEKIKLFDQDVALEEDYEIEESILEPYERKIFRRIQRSRNIIKYSKEKRRIKSLPKMKKETFYNLKNENDDGNEGKSASKEIKNQYFLWKKKSNLSDMDIRSKSHKTSVISASNFLKKKKFDHIVKLLEHRTVKRNRSRSRYRDSNSVNINSKNLRSEGSRNRNNSYDVARRELEKKKKKLNIPSKKDLKNISLRLCLGKKNRVKMAADNVVTKSSLQLSKLEKKILKLSKIADKNRNGNLGMTRKKFLELIMCEYKGKKRVLEQSEKNPYKSEVMNFDSSKINPFSGSKKRGKLKQEVLDPTRLKAFLREKREFKRLKGMPESSHSLLGSSEEIDIMFEEPILRSNEKDESSSSPHIKRSTTLESNLFMGRKMKTKPTLFVKKPKDKVGIFPFLDSISRHMELSSLIDDSNLDSAMKKKRDLRERVEFENMLLNENWQLAVSVLSKVRKGRRNRDLDSVG